MPTRVIGPLLDLLESTQTFQMNGVCYIKIFNEWFNTLMRKIILFDVETFLFQGCTVKRVKAKKLALKCQDFNG